LSDTTPTINHLSLGEHHGGEEPYPTDRRHFVKEPLPRGVRYAAHAVSRDGTETYMASGRETLEDFLQKVRLAFPPPCTAAVGVRLIKIDGGIGPCILTEEYVPGELRRLSEGGRLDWV
jgi:hypothetical protein